MKKNMSSRKLNKVFSIFLSLVLVFQTIGPGILVVKIAHASSPAPVNLLSAGNFTILSKTGISTTGVTSITGDIGVSPIGYAAITGFALNPTIPNGTNTFATSSLVTGNVYASDYTAPTPATLTTAVSDMQAAYTDANSRATDVLNAGAGNLAGLNLVAGVYKFDGVGNVLITGDVTLSGSASDVWIFQIPGTLDVSANKKVLLSGGALPSNIFWAVAGTTTLEPGSVFEGNILAGPGASTIAMQNGAVLNGRALGQTDVTLIGNTITVSDSTPPTPSCSGTTSFDGSPIGSVNGQEGWSVTGAYDQAIVNNTYGYSSFGCKSLRLSNAVTNGSFGDQTFSPSIVNEAGETTSTNGGMSGGVRQNHFEAEFGFASTQSTQQPGLLVSVSPDRGDGSRMSYLRFEDHADGIRVIFSDVQGAGNPANFVETQVATALSRTTAHTAKFVIDYLDGPSNDVVKIYIDGVLVHTGTTWENYFRFDTESVAEQTPRTTDDLIFRVGGVSAPATSGNGFLFDNITLTSSIVAITPPADLTVIKHVVGGTATAGQFTITVTGGSPSPAVFHPSETGTDVDLQDSSTYSVTEGAYEGYTASYSPECSGLFINANHPKTCTITNTYVPPVGEPGFGPFHLNVIKHVVGGTATAGQFTVNATGGSASPSVFHPSESGTDVTLDAFSDYTVTEDAFANYTPSYSPDCSGTSVNEFHPKTCTITNTYVPPTGGGEGDPNTGHIIVDKVTNPAGDETSFDFTTTGTGYNAFSLKDDTAPNNQTLLVGAYSVTEGSLSGWTLTNTVCTSTLDEVSVNPNTFNLHANETITCTFTNTKDSTPPSGGGDSGGNLIVARGGGGRPPVSQGAVLGASTTNNGGQVLGAETSCGIYLDKFLRKGYKENNVDGVKKLQQFLNDYFKAELKVDGIFGKSTEVALKKFQIEHKEKILAPWHITIPTGIFYLTTQAEINNIMCPTLNLPIPTNLIPFDSNPESPKI